MQEEGIIARDPTRVATRCPLQPAARCRAAAGCRAARCSPVAQRYSSCSDQQQVCLLSSFCLSDVLESFLLSLINLLMKKDYGCSFKQLSWK